MAEQASRSVEDLFQEALDVSPAAREDFLRRRAPNDATLRARVAKLIQAYEGAEGEFEARASLLPPETEPLPTRVGRYPVDSALAEGGMSIVYLARQEQPPRPIALKVIRPSLATEGMMARFELEAAMLAKLRHPGIAHVYDAGRAQAVFEGGRTASRAFMAMELIAGEPVTSFARARNFTLAQRVGIIAEICDALHAAHQQGVIHRDLKPANILVDQEGRPKILDFGAAALLPELWPSPRSAAGHVSAGTGPYLSPEHAGGDVEVLDTRSDVYSMGVILYELLAGRTPTDVAGLPLDEAARRVQSAEIRPLAETNRDVPADLSLVVGRALARRKQDRYSSAADFAADLRRFLRREPVSARPSSLLYSARMLVKRRPGLVTAGLVAVSALVVVAAVAVQQAVLASREASAKAVALASAADARDEAEGAVEFLAEMLSSADPGALGRDVRVREVLDRAAPAVGEHFKGRPSSEARAREAIGSTYVGLGDYDAALAQLERAYAIRVANPGPEHLVTARTELAYATALACKERSEEARSHYVHSEVVLERELGSDHPDVVAAILGQARVAMQLQEFERALQLFQKAIAPGDRRAESMQESDFSARLEYAFALRRLGKHAESAELYGKTIPRLRKELGGDHPLTRSAISGAAGVDGALGRAAESEALMRELLAARERVLGPDHADTLGAVNNLAILLGSTGRTDEAVKLFDRVISGATRALGPLHRNTLKARFNLAQVYSFAGDFKTAEEVLLPVLELQERQFGPEHVDIADSLQVLATCQSNLGDVGGAVENFSRAIAMFSKLVGPDDVTVIRLRLERGNCFLSLGRAEEAEPDLDRAADWSRSQGSRWRPQEVRALEKLAACKTALGKADEAAAARTRLEDLAPAVGSAD